jgi:hypothetical protein
MVNIELKNRKFDYLFIVFFSWAFITCIISDAIPTLGIAETPHSSNVLARWNYSYASVNDPLFLHPPVLMRFVTGLSAIVYAPLYLVLVYALIRRKNWIQIFAVMHGTLFLESPVWSSLE